MKRPRDAEKITFDAWLASTERNLDFASAQDVIESVKGFAQLSQRDMTELDWVPSGMSKTLRTAQTDLSAGRIVELPQGRNSSLWTITAVFSPVKQAKTKNQVQLDKRTLARLYADRKKLKVRS